MNRGPNRGALYLAAGVLGGAGVSAFAVGWDRWSYCWERGSYRCAEAQNDPPYPGVMSPWSDSVMSVSWVLVAIGFVAVTVALWRMRRAAALWLLPATVGVVAWVPQATELGGANYEPWWMSIPVVVVWPWALGAFAAAAAALLFAEEDEPGEHLDARKSLIGALVALALAAPVAELCVLLLFDFSHDTQTLTGMYSGVLYLAAAVLCVVAARRAGRGPGGQRPGGAACAVYVRPASRASRSGGAG